MSAYHELIDKIIKVRSECHSVGIRPNLKAIATRVFFDRLEACPEYKAGDLIEVEVSDNLTGDVFTVINERKVT